MQPFLYGYLRDSILDKMKLWSSLSDIGNVSCSASISVEEASACDAINSVHAVSALEPSDLLSSTSEYKDKSLCVANNCCWFKGECYQKPSKCADCVTA